MKLTFRLSAAVLVAIAPVAADAGPLRFTITGDYNATFTIDSSPTPNEFIGGTGFVVWNTPGVFDGTAGAVDAGFFDGSLGGGLSLIDYDDFDPYFVADGPQLYTGSVETPTFLTGTFQLSEYEGAGRYTLTIADADASVPEPATWASMIAGFGLVGGTARRSRRTTALA